MIQATLSENIIIYTGAKQGENVDMKLYRSGNGLNELYKINVLTVHPVYTRIFGMLDHQVRLPSTQK